MRLLGYVRVSTQDQASGGHSIRRQPELLAAWCQHNGHELVDVIVDGDLGEEGGAVQGVSAGRPLATRQGGAELLARLRAGDAEGVVVYSVFRLFRDTLDGLMFFRRVAKPLGVQVFSLSEAIDVTRASGRFALTVLLATAEYERDTTCERTQAIVQGLKERGRVYGHAPYGTVAHEGSLFRDPARWATRERIVALRCDGYSLDTIARLLRDEAITAPSGGTRWSKSTLSAICSTHADLLHLPELPAQLSGDAAAAPDSEVSHVRHH